MALCEKCQCSSVVCEDSKASMPAYLEANEETSDPCQELNELDASILKVEEYLAELSRKKSPIKTRINRIHSLILCKLPPELLARIFTFYIPHISEPVGKSIKPASDPLRLGAVCRMWRNVAWSTPELWATMSLYMAFSKIPVLTELIEQWLGRSGQLPLSIRLWCGPGEDRKGSDLLVHAMLGAISRYSSRWRRLELRIPTAFFTGFNYKEDESLILEALHLDPPDGQADRTENFSFGRTPNLTKLHISSIYLKAVSIHWDNITHIYASAFYYDECLEILQRCPLVQHCQFSSIINGDDGYSIPEDIIHLPDLKYLRISNDGPSVPTSVLTKISAPMLDEFVFHPGGRVVNSDDIIDFIARSGCTLSAFTLSKGDIVPDDLIRILDNMPSLQRLNIAAGDVASLNLTDEVIQRLNSGCTSNKNASNKPLLPRLVSFEYSGNQSFTWKPFMDMICNHPRPESEPEPTTGKAGTPATVVTRECSGHQHSLNNISLTFSRQDGVDLTLLDKDTLKWFMKLMDSDSLSLSITHGSKDVFLSSLETHCPGDEQRYNELRSRVKPSAA